MWQGVDERVRALLARVRRFERRELRAHLAWLENTQNLVHLNYEAEAPSSTE